MPRDKRPLARVLRLQKKILKLQPSPQELPGSQCPVYKMSPSSTPRSLNADGEDRDSHIIFQQFIWHNKVRDAYDLLMKNVATEGGLQNADEFVCLACNNKYRLTEEHLLSPRHQENLWIMWSDIYQEEKNNGKGSDLSWLVQKYSGAKGKWVQTFECMNGRTVWFNHGSLASESCQPNGAMSSTSVYQ